MKSSIFICSLAMLSLGLITLISCEGQAPVSPQAEDTESIVRHERDISSNEAWPADKTHIVRAELRVTNAILKIAPGTTVQFEQNAGIIVDRAAGLIADGSEQPIIFTSSDTTKGNWNYIYFSSDALHDSCRMINCSLQYAGGDPILNAAIVCNDATPTIVGCKISHSPNVGIKLIGDCRGITLENNTITNCDFVPIQTDIYNVSSIGSNAYQANGLNQIRIIKSELDFDDHWRYPGVPFRLADGLNITNARLTIDPAAELIFEADESLIVSHGGAIQAVGDPTSPIVFTGSSLGSWNGVHFLSSSNFRNTQLSHCIIEHAGRDAHYRANLVLDRAWPIITNCLIHRSSGYGVYIIGPIKAGFFQNNRITQNALAPLSVSANAVAGLTSGDYHGNGNDWIEVRGAPLEKPITSDCYWDRMDLPYFITGMLQIQSATLFLSPGTELLMAEHSGIEILSQGGLIADGTSRQITITAARPTPGFWDGIFFTRAANASHCQLIRCRIAYAGADARRPGIIWCDNISPIIRSCSIEYSLGYGIYLVGNSNIVDLQSNWFIANAKGNYYQHP
ncbi:MAG: hypothetical protein ONB32_06195 [candidate division KSB1 bacterium]|nr:hypothetical protein [candidate division KSB1 bacterium]MDZ7400382.1 hypothetical protein [candidate division KSB1 bacterium]